MRASEQNRANSADKNSAWSSATHLKHTSIGRVKPKGRVICVVVMVFLLAIINPHAFLQITQIIIAAIVIVMASLRIFASLLGVYTLIFHKTPAQKTPIEALKNWPQFTVLVPLFNEAGMVKSLMDNLGKLDYPSGKLDIIMVCEADDGPTWCAVKRHIHPPFKLFKVDPSEPRTKPKALNSALKTIPKTAHNDIITIYDAEDRPHPYQLKAAALALVSDPELAAVQAPLGYYNDRQNLLTQFFALEYAALFHVWNPALYHLHLPFTLGGTSNHIRRNVVDSADGWDSYNVTEDADLSFKINALSQKSGQMKIGCIAYGTQEEAVDNYTAWIQQRSRWLKGFLQTWAVHMRAQTHNPAGGKFRMKPRITNTIALQITIGSTLLNAFLHVPSLLIIGGLLVANALHIIDFSLSPAFYTFIGLGYGASIMTGIIGAVIERKPHLIFLAPLMPFYWILQFPAALIASWEYITAPSYWRKTTHKGKDEISAATPLEEHVKLPI